MAHPKHQVVRVRYAFRCGYCGVSETDAGGKLTVDHFHPVSAGGIDGDDNLVYACVRCNLYKGAFTPSEAEGAQGLRLLHPLHDNLTAHLREASATGILAELTPTGAFHIVTLNLNRTPLIANRQQCWRNAQLLARLDQAEARSAETEDRLQRRDACIRTLEERLKRLTEQDGTED